MLREEHSIQVRLSNNVRDGGALFRQGSTTAQIGLDSHKLQDRRHQNLQADPAQTA